ATAAAGDVAWDAPPPAPDSAPADAWQAPAPVEPEDDAPAPLPQDEPISPVVPAPAQAAPVDDTTAALAEQAPAPDDAWSAPAPPPAPEWSAPAAPPPPPAAAWNSPAVGASALEQLESEPPEPEPSAAKELFGTVPDGGMLSGDDDEGYGPPEELASPEEVLRP